MNESKTWMKVILIIVLLLIVVPLAIFIFIQFAPREIPAQDEAVTAEASDKTTAHQEPHVRRESRAARQETASMEPEPEQNFEGVGAVVPNAPRSKQMTPYEPGTVPGDSGIVPQLAEPPDDMMSGPQPLPPDGPWGGAVLPLIPPENMRGIGGVRQIDPNDPFFQQDIPNPFAD